MKKEEASVYTLLVSNNCYGNAYFFKSNKYIKFHIERMVSNNTSNFSHYAQPSNIVTLTLFPGSL